MTYRGPLSLRTAIAVYDRMNHDVTRHRYAKRFGTSYLKQDWTYVR